MSRSLLAPLTTPLTKLVRKLSARAPKNALELADIFLGISNEVKDRSEDAAEIRDLCRRIAETLKQNSANWSAEPLKARGEAAQRNVDHVLGEARDWKKRWYDGHIVNTVQMDRDLVNWKSNIAIALSEYTLVLVGGPLTNGGRASTQAPMMVLAERADQELHSPISQLTQEEREILTRNLRAVLTTDSIPDVVRLPGELHKSPRPPKLAYSSDVWEGTWRYEKNGKMESEIVAIKCLRDPNPSEARARRFRYEGTLWRLLSHPNIVPFFGINIVNDDVVELVSLWIRNGDAMSYIAANPNCNRRKIIKGTAHGLAFLHRCEVVHGSIRGANILISDTGNAMITDFGLAAASTADGELITDGMSSSRPQATARWCAPEVILTTNAVPVMASDVFSFASTILELMTGKVPMSDVKNPLLVATKIADKDFRMPRPKAAEVVQRGLSDEVWTFLNKMWCYEVGKRLAMDVVEKELDRLL